MEDQSQGFQSEYEMKRSPEIAGLGVDIDGLGEGWSSTTWTMTGRELPCPGGVRTAKSICTTTRRLNVFRPYAEAGLLGETGGRT